MKLSDYNYEIIDVEKEISKPIRYTKEMFGEDAWIRVDKLKIDIRVQRELQDFHVDRILRKFDPSSFGRISVSPREDGFYYVDGEDFDSGNYIVQLGTETADTGTRTMLYTLFTELEGVYNVNKGYAVFKRIESLVEDTDYLIVKENTKAGLAVYDHIVLDATTAAGAIISNGGVHW